MSKKKSVKLLIFLLVIALGGILAFGTVSSDDTAGKLNKKQLEMLKQKLSKKRAVAPVEPSDGMTIKEAMLRTKAKKTGKLTRTPRTSPVDANPAPTIPSMPTVAPAPTTNPVPVPRSLPTSLNRTTPSIPFSSITNRGAKGSPTSAPTAGGMSVSQGSLDCMTDMLQDMIVNHTEMVSEPNSVTGYDGMLLEERFNTMILSSNLDDFLRVAIKDQISEIDDITSTLTYGAVAPDVEGTMDIEYEYDGNDFKQSARVTMEGMTLGLIGDIDVVSNAIPDFHATIELVNPVLTFDIDADLTADFTYGQHTQSNTPVEYARDNILDSSVNAELVSLTASGIEVSNLRRLNNTLDPILAAWADNNVVVDGESFDFTSSAADGFLNDDSSATLLGSRIGILARDAAMFAARQSLEDGMDASYIPEMIYDDGEIKVHACSPEDHEDFSVDSSFAWPYLRHEEGLIPIIR